MNHAQIVNINEIGESYHVTFIVWSSCISYRTHAKAFISQTILVLMRTENKVSQQV